MGGHNEELHLNELLNGLGLAVGREGLSREVRCRGLEVLLQVMKFFECFYPKNSLRFALI